MENLANDVENLLDYWLDGQAQISLEGISSGLQYVKVSLLGNEATLVKGVQIDLQVKGIGQLLANSGVSNTVWMQIRSELYSVLYEHLIGN